MKAKVWALRADLVLVVVWPTAHSVSPAWAWATWARGSQRETSRTMVCMYQVYHAATVAHSASTSFLLSSYLLLFISLSDAPKTCSRVTEGNIMSILICIAFVSTPN